MNTMSDNNLPLLQQIAWQEVYENSKKRAFARTLCSRNEVNTVIQEIRKGGGFDSRSFEECILFGNRISQVNLSKQCRYNFVVMSHRSNSNLLDLVKCDFICCTIVELCRARAFMCGDRLSVL